MVPKKGLEPLHLTATASKTVVSTNSTTWANMSYLCVFVVYPSSLCFGGMAPMGRLFHRLASSHIYQLHHLGILNFSGARDGT